MGAIATAFERSDKANPLYIGSVKPNIGHLEGGAGIAGMIKAVLSVEAGVIPPNVNFEKPNPKLRLDEFNLKVPVQPTPWPTNGLRRVSVNSFGYGGTKYDSRYSGLGLMALTTIVHTVSLTMRITI